MVASENININELSKKMADLAFSDFGYSELISIYRSILIDVSESFYDRGGESMRIVLSNGNANRKKIIDEKFNNVLDELQ